MNESLDIRERKNLMLSLKEDRQSFAQSVVMEVAEGFADACEVLTYAKKAIDIFTQIEKNVKPHVKNIPKCGIQTCNGTSITEKKDPDKFDFTVCGDPVWDRYQERKAELLEDIKERETFLKALKEPVAISTGVYAGTEILPPSITYGAQNLAVSIK